jgi:integrase
VTAYGENAVSAHTGFSWGFVVDAGVSQYGKRRQVRRSGFATRSEAETKLHEELAFIDAGATVADRGISLAAFVRETWLPATAPPRVRWKTWDDRRQQLETYVIPRLGHLELRDIRADQLSRLYGDLLTTGRVRSSGGLSPSSVHIVHRTLRKVFADAVRWGVLPRNPTDHADPPPLRAVQSARRSSMRAWSPEETARFLEGVRHDPLYPMWHFAVTTGVRRSELLGLHWPDLDLEARTATIRHTVLTTVNGHEVVDDQKSRTSARTIHLDRRTCEVLAQHRQQQDQHYRELGINGTSAVVFTDVHGAFLKPERVTKAFRRLVRAAGVPPIRLHDVRHSHATLL